MYSKRYFIYSQYNKSDSPGMSDRPSVMSGTLDSQASYNDAFQMVPTAGKLFSGFGKTINSLSENNQNYNKM